MGDAIIRRLPISPSQKKPVVFLTFDDGPDPETTPQVLDILKKHGARATFFVIGQNAEKNSELVEQTLRDHHRLGNHSLDHRYSHFFKPVSDLKKWIQKSELALERFCETHELAGFRPPAGIVTPFLRQALKELDIPLLLWSRRFFDAVLPLTRFHLRVALPQIKSGDIVLFHDRQPRFRRALFLSNLDFFVRELKNQGWQLEALPERSQWQWSNDRKENK